MTAPSIINSNDLLRRLDAVVRPGAPIDRQALTLFDANSFDNLLSQAAAGTIRSGRPVTCACEMQPPLEPAQLERLAAAADRAEAQGCSRALMMIDGRGVVVDVQSRMVISELKPDGGDAVLRVDGAMVVPGADTFADHHPRNGSAFAGINDLTAARLRAAAG